MNLEELKKLNADQLRKIIKTNWNEAVKTKKIKKIHRVGKRYGLENKAGDNCFLYHDNSINLTIIIDQNISSIQVIYNEHIVCDNTKDFEFFIPGNWFDRVDYLYDKKPTSNTNPCNNVEKEELISKIILGD